MRRRATILLAPLATALLTAPVASAHDGGEGWYGETTDKVVTNAGFILIIAFPLIVLGLSMLQWRLDRRKDARKRAVKARATSERWRGGW